MSKFGEIPRKLQEYLETFCTIEGQWWKTIKYDEFHLLTANREVESITALKRSVESDGYHPVPATIIYREGRLWVKGGQHRLELCKELNLPFYFTIDMVNNHERGFDLVVGEIGTTPWRLKDFLRAHANSGNETYRDIMKLREKSKYVVGKKNKYIEPSQLIYLITGITPGGAFYNNTNGEANVFKHGDFKPAKEDIENAECLIKELLELAPYVGANYSRREFMRAYFYISRKRGFRVRHLIKKLAIYTDPLIGCSSFQDFGEALMMIYNYHANEEDRIKDLNWKEVAREMKRKFMDKSKHQKS